MVKPFKQAAAFNKVNREQEINVQRSTNQEARKVSSKEECTDRQWMRPPKKHHVSKERSTQEQVNRTMYSSSTRNRTRL